MNELNIVAHASRIAIAIIVIAELFGTPAVSPLRATLFGANSRNRATYLGSPRLAVEQAKKSSMLKDSIERAVSHKYGKKSDEGTLGILTVVLTYAPSQ